MQSEIDQAANPQSIEDKIGDALWGNQEQEAEEQESAGADDQATDDGEDGEQPEGQSDEVAEPQLEVDGEKWTPSKLKAELDKARDYTRKTQTLADERRLFESTQRTVYEQQKFMESAQEEIKRLQSIESQLEQYRGVDLSQIDAEMLSRMSIAAGNLREERAKLKESIDGKRAEFQTNVVKMWDEMSAKAREVIVKNVPNWDKIAPQIAQYAINEGFPYEHITGHDRQSGARIGPGVVDPTFARMLHKAMQWDQLQATKSATMAKAKNAPPLAKPGASNSLPNDRVQTLQFKKALKGAGSDSRRAELIGDRVMGKFFR
jgi:hypothetical protein